ncbi:HigA family addiction module antitoxin [Pseudoxanthomonas sacheonensis]|uniref:Addiction module HigA family antidote n=1 Tax=Pseudoxanthomonas sacheonensis TaxID=443615 RepID=A0ABU1RRC5_9GAMM|nr:HigA family addiction module antitoxin [Pseudoxanthomonas sacheonensis]MDR6841329.1 addiction module HigA family antidote [Pseudoxanthomonas sacheonensis]
MSKHSANNSPAAGSSAIHPGQYIRESILAPKKLSVLAAAKLVGVGRPAFSNFLHGHVAATPEMASRIEVAFGVSARTLLDMQSAFDAAEAKAKAPPANAVPYVVPFLGIKGNDLETWVNRAITPRSRFSVLLRTLANSTSRSITKIDFPGNDDAERPGWDGYIESKEATQWLPEGISGWEFGTNKDINRKADDDFAKSIKAVSKEDRGQTTFVFVTPRYWAEKKDWLQKAKAKKQWKDVRAYDSSDLEQWLEQSLAGQTWFANETLRPSADVWSLDKCWDDWANVTNPPLVGSLFLPAIEASKRTVASRLTKDPDGPISIAADSVEEGLAFLSQIFGPAGGVELAKYRDRVLVFDQPGSLPKLAQGTKDFIPVATSRQVERELASLARSMHTIVIYPRNAANVTPDVVLEPLNYDAFRSALEEMKLGRDDVTRYINESGRSLTILRRRIANVAAVRTPAWAEDPDIASSLVPFLFAGAWSSANTADQTVLALLADESSYEKLEKECQRLVSLDDPPLWSVGTSRGVASKIDLLFSIAGSITRQDLQRFFSVAKRVLGEDDPSLDLPEEERWAAAIHGKSREFSAAIRDGVSETLVLLAVHGNHLFQDRLGFNCDAAASHLVEDLLTPLKTRILEANDRNLSAYSEAAPDRFLSILEEDLKTPEPETYGLLKPVDTGMFGGSRRSGLLWALEGLAWNVETLPRVALILAQLAEIDIKDNLSNKPFSSLDSIVCSWMPQTTADHATRVKVVKKIAEKHPKVAWRICVSQFDTSSKIGTYSHKPTWRNDAYGSGEPFGTWGPVFDFKREMLEMAINWKTGHSKEMLCDLIHNLPGMSDEYQSQVWGLIKVWADADASDADKAFVREKVRVTVMSRRGARRSKEQNFPQLSAKAKITYKALEPSDLLNKHEWLFRQHWVEESADELQDDDHDYHKREARIAKLRTEALKEILDAKGISGVLKLAEMGKAPSLVGRYLGAELLSTSAVPAFLLSALSSSVESLSWARKEVIAGALRSIEDEDRVRAIENMKGEIPAAHLVQLLLLTPFRRSSWRFVDDLEEADRKVYWKNVVPDWSPEEETNEAVQRLLVAERPRAAFAAIHIHMEILAPELLYQLMVDMLKEGQDRPGEYQMDQHYLERAFVLLDKNPGLTVEQKAVLELGYIDALSRPWSQREGYGIPNLERYVELHPEVFVHAVAWAYRRDDEGKDPEEFQVAPDLVKNFAKRGYKLLEGLSRVPGQDDLGELEEKRLGAWVKAVREACSQIARLEVGDICIGKLLSTAEVGDDGVWPCVPVRQVLEDIHSRAIMRGAHTGLYNSRGAIWRGEGGDQERGLADKYRAWANELQYSHPFVASELLMGMARTYEAEASREDTQARIRRRMR